MISPRSDPKKMMMYPARRPGSSSVPHSKTAKTNTTNRFEKPGGAILNRTSLVMWNVMNRIVSRDDVVNIVVCFM